MTAQIADAPLTVREATDRDLPAVLELLQASLGWVPDDDYARFFAWKHHDSPFGRSPAWVAVDPSAGDRVVGFRTFMRWQFRHGLTTVDAVRAVDTATHPDYQGRGIFSRLTRHALDDLRQAGVAFVFNTPNDRSRPGYLKMGWQLVDRLSVAATPRSLGSLVRLARARTPADKWSTATDAGVPVRDLLADGAAIEALLVEVADGDRLQTRRTPAYLAWRYGFPALRYRAMVAAEGPPGGVVIFRLRRRGAALEAALCEALVPGDDRRRAQRLVRAVLRGTGADHAVQIGAAAPTRGLLPVPGQGPTLVWRDVNDTAMPPADRWDLSLGDIELF
jgi:ribosomal protein S18 acetylase RimI-like enzyme